MAYVDILSVADSAILTYGIDITAKNFMPIPVLWSDSQSPEFYGEGEYSGTFSFGGDTYAVSFSYDDEVYIDTGTEYLDVMGSGITDESETNGGMIAFSYGNADSYISFVTNNMVPELSIYDYFDVGASFTAKALGGNDFIVIEQSAHVEAFAGNDTVLGSSGSDTIFAGKTGR